MNASRFDEVVRNRANQRVTQKIAAFRKTIAEAFTALHPDYKPNYYDGWDHHSKEEDLKVIFTTLSSLGSINTWPVKLWDTESDAVQKELLETMDEMAKALIAPMYPQPNDPKPAAPNIPVK